MNASKSTNAIVMEIKPTNIPELTLATLATCAARITDDREPRSTSGAGVGEILAWIDGGILLDFPNGSTVYIAGPDAERFLCLIGGIPNSESIQISAR